jgi:putative SOS response-associated peptidase YedK
MCYSAQVIQHFKKLTRLTGARIDYAQVELLFQRRLTDSSIKVSRALEANFDEPENDIERRIQGYIQTFRSRQITGWEQALFAQKKRLADAQRKLQVKETKKAREEERIATAKIQWHVDKLNDMKRTELNEEDHRIFPMWYAPVLVQTSAGLQITLMRYHCRPAGKPKSIDRQFDGLYNARRDSLDNFWREQFGRHHAICVLDGFYENVERHRVEGRELAPGEKPQNVVLHFKPRPATAMFVPCIWSHWSQPGEEDLQSFAIITDEPPQEVAAAGHDRCPINLRRDRIEAWLSPEGMRRSELYRLLDEREQPYYEHEVLAA